MKDNNEVKPFSLAESLKAFELFLNTISDKEHAKICEAIDKIGTHGPTLEEYFNPYQKLQSQLQQTQEELKEAKGKIEELKEKAFEVRALMNRMNDFDIGEVLPEEVINQFESFLKGN